MPARRSGKGLTFRDVCDIASAFPGVEVSTSYGTPALKVRGKLLARLKEDGETMMLRVSFVVRDHLMQTSPKIFFITDHYRDYPSVLVRLAVAKREVITQLLEDAWRDAAPTRLVRELDARAAKNTGKGDVR